MSQIPLPLPRVYSRHQEDLIWRFSLADSDLGLRSNQGQIQARLEGESGDRVRADLVDDPAGSLAEVTSSPGFRAAGRARRIDHYLTGCTVVTRGILTAAYSRGPQLGLEAWGSLANLVLFSREAREAWGVGRQTPFLEWAVRLSGRRIGVLGRDGRRKPPRATQREVEICAGIRRDCEVLLSRALREYVVEAWQEHRCEL